MGSPDTESNAAARTPRLYLTNTSSVLVNICAVGLKRSNPELKKGDMMELLCFSTASMYFECIPLLLLSSHMNIFKSMVGGWLVVFMCVNCIWCFVYICLYLYFVFCILYFVFCIFVYICKRIYYDLNE